MSINTNQYKHVVAQREFSGSEAKSLRITASEPLNLAILERFGCLLLR
ncbi:hypothetical protein [uncultured Shewanella sp.]|nr:hypothetical protein [uncultured Shewanella sp.]